MTELTAASEILLAQVEKVAGVEVGHHIIVNPEFLRDQLTIIEAEAIKRWVASEELWDGLVDRIEGNPGYIVGALTAIADSHG